LLLPHAQQFWKTRSDGKEQQNVEVSLWLRATSNKKARNNEDGQESNKNNKKKRSQTFQNSWMKLKGDHGWFSKKMQGFLPFARKQQLCTLIL